MLYCTERISDDIGSRPFGFEEMAYELTPEGDLIPRRRRWIEIVLVIGFFASLLVAVGALAGVYLLNLSGEQEAQLPEPIQAVDPAKIPPHWALVQLVEDSGEALALQAINANELALAYATIQFDADLSNSRRAGLLLLLGRRYQASEQPKQAALTYQIARTVAILAADLTPIERGQALVASAEGLLLAGDVEQALATALQAEQVAAYSPDLLPAQRDEILRRVEPIIKQHGTSEQVRRLRDLRRSLAQAPSGVSLVSQWRALLDPAEPDPLLGQALSVRREAAQRLLDRVRLTGGQDIEPERDAVRQALLVEDQVRREITRQALAAGPSLARQHWWLQEQRAWIVLKLRIASGGFGVRLVPEWESNPEQLRTELGATTDQLAKVLYAQINAQVEPVQREMLRVETLRWLALQYELGYYPGADIVDIADQLAAAQVELSNQGYHLAMPLTFLPEARLPRFRYVSE
jgi:hypothetical protein